ncbi:MAG: bifunctional phosphoribosylaminoimidazolecarboxamide formyltransferase/IMP cyclohydrolase [Nitrospinota bacterium]
MPRIRRAILSVSEKRGLVELARALVEGGAEVLSTGGTAQVLREAGLPVTDVSAFTGQPEMLGGRVKTLGPKLLGGILGRRSVHGEEMERLGIPPVDLVAVNLYPLREALAGGPLGDPKRQAAWGAPLALEEALELVDVGGVTLARAAAKNFEEVVVLVDPDDYPPLLPSLRNGEDIAIEVRRRLAAKAFRLTAACDAAVARYLAGEGEGGEAFPPWWLLELCLHRPLRYGENPHQGAAFYRWGEPRAISLADARKLQGKELSYNNLLDLEAALRLAAEFEEPAAAIVKHTNPCGLGLGPSPRAAFERALATDPVSAFGGVVGFNRPLDGEAAEALAQEFIECVVAPACEEEARRRLARKKNLRLLELPALGEWKPMGAPELEIRSVPGGVLIQEEDAPRHEEWKTVTRRPPTEEEREALRVAWRVVRHVKSNAIVLADRQGTVGVGAGQMSRVDAARLAVEKARLPTRGSALASDAFFPFADSVEVAAGAGVTAIIQPGGSRRDGEVIEAADRFGLAMVFTGTRHFRH